MTTNDDTDPLVGRVLDGRYEIVRRLARGGMAVVYLGNDLRLSRTVAVKVMHESLGGDADFVARFNREACAAAGLSHPNIVSVFDQGVDNGRPYIVMEYVEGRTLRQVMAREGAMTPQRAVDLLLPVASAVAAAHEAGIVHRDLKPENVLIGERGQTKVADFGLARAVTAQTSAASGTLIGTVSYIAPELVTQGSGDQRTDVYALGVVLYEMLTGRKPHTGENPIQVAYSHVHHEIEPPSNASPTPLPDYVDALVTQAAARDPRVRPRNASVLADDLRLVRDALLAGKGSDPLLVARIRGGAADPSESLTAPLPVNTTRVLPSTDKTTVLHPPTPSLPEPAQARPAVVAPSAAELQQRRKRRRRQGLAAILIVLLTTALVGVGAWYYLDGRFVNVPDFGSLTQAKAEVLADKTGIQVTFENTYSETVPSGQIINTDPPTGSPVLRGGTVLAYLSKGPERYKIPDVKGMTLDAATQALTDAHLQRGSTSQVYDDKAKAGTVVAMSAKPGTLVKKDTAVDLDVSQGPAPVTVMDYTGKPLTDAQTFFDAAGLKVKVTKEVNDKTIPKGSIVTQTPKDGELPRGSTVSVTVSKGPRMVVIPNVRRLSADLAKKKLQDAGFKVQTVTLFFASMATGTKPGAGQQAPEGSTVTLYLA